MKKRIGIILATLAVTVAVSIPVCAATTDLDVQAGDIYSYYTYKDTGNEWENYYYVTTETYVGYPVIACSSSQTGGYSSPFTIMEYGKKKYIYDNNVDAPGGIYYRLTAGPSNQSGSNWHLTGRYSP